MELDNQQADNIMLNNIWPTELDEYAFLLETGRTLQQFSFDDPYNSTLSDLVHEVRIERPDISMDYLAELISVDLETLSEIIARKSSSIN